MVLVRKNIEVTIIKLVRDSQLLAKIITPLLITGIFAANKIPNGHGLKFTHMISVFNLVGSLVKDPKRPTHFRAINFDLLVGWLETVKTYDSPNGGEK